MCQGQVKVKTKLLSYESRAYICAILHNDISIINQD